MINSLDRIFDGIVQMLRDDVLPRIDDEFARGQVYGAMDLLGNLKTRVEWDAGALRGDVTERTALVAKITPLLGGLGPDAPQTGVSVEATSRELEDARRRLDEHLCRVLDWISAHRSELPAERAAEIEAAIRDQQRPELRRAVKRTAPPLLGEMSRGQ
jgi:hypothetical protein